MIPVSQFSTELARCHEMVKQVDVKGQPRRKRLRFHLFDGIGKRGFQADTPSDTLLGPSDVNNLGDTAAGESSTAADAEGSGPSTEKEMTMKEAMALLEGREYIPETLNIWQRLHKLEALTHTPSSVYAMKLAAAAIVFGSLIWAEGSREFFILYNISGSLLTIVVAL